MALVTPARVKALAVVAAASSLCLVTTGTVSWFQYADTDSVPRLSDARACTLARAATWERHHARREKRERSCHVVSFDERVGVVQVDDDFVCFQKAGRWFVVLDDARTAEECPTTTPERGRITTFKAELHLENDWKYKVREARDTRAAATFKSLLVASARAWRATPAPATCPAFERGDIEALDLGLLFSEGAPAWHYLSGDQVETALTSDRYLGRYEVQALWRDVPYLLFVDAIEKRQPFETSTGSVKGKVAVVDWQRAKVLCEAPFAFEQSPDSERDPDSLAPYLPIFKEQVYGVLSETLALMSDQQLTLAKTW